MSIMQFVERDAPFSLSLSLALLGDTDNALAIEFRDDSYAQRTSGALSIGMATELVTIARASTKRRFNSSGLMVDAASGALSLDHDPAAQDIEKPSIKKRLGARIEGAVTEITSFTEAADNAYWTKAACTITPDVAAFLDGLLTMDKMVEGAGSVSPAIYRTTSTITSGQPYWLGRFMKAGDLGSRHRVRLICTGGFGANAIFDLVAGTFVHGSGDGSAMIDCGNGIYFCALYDLSTSTVAGNLQTQIYPNTSGNPPYTGDGASGIYLGPVNFYIGPALSSYIPKLDSTAASRAADTVTLPVASIPSWSATTGVVEISGRAPYSYSTSVLFQIDDGTENERFRIERDASSNIRCIVTDGGVEQCNLDLGVVAAGADFSVAFAWAANDFAASLNGGTAVTDTGGTLPTVTTMRFGQSFTGEHWNATIASALYQAAP